MQEVLASKPVEVIFEEESNDIPQILNHGNLEPGQGLLSSSLHVLGNPLIVHNLKMLISAYRISEIKLPNQHVAELAQRSLPDMHISTYESAPNPSSERFLKLPLDSIITSSKFLTESAAEFIQFEEGLQSGFIDGFLKIKFPWDVLSAMHVALKELEMRNSQEIKFTHAPDLNSISPSSIIGEDCAIAKGTQVGHFSILTNGVSVEGASIKNHVEIQGPVSIGSESSVDSHTIIRNMTGRQLIMGRRCKVGSHGMIVGPGIIDEDVQIGDSVKIVGPFYIGKKSRVGDGARIRHSMMDENCLIGMNSEVARSYIARGSKVGHVSCILDSLLGENVGTGAYVGTTNRLWMPSDRIKVRLNSAFIDPKLKKLGAIVGAGGRIATGTTLLPGRIMPPNTELPVNYVYESFEKFDSERKAKESARLQKKS